MPYLPLGQMPVQTAERSVVTSVESRHEDVAQPLTNATRPAGYSNTTEEVDQQVAKPKSTAPASEDLGALGAQASEEPLGVFEVLGLLGTYQVPAVVAAEVLGLHGLLGSPLGPLGPLGPLVYAHTYVGDREKHGVTENPIDKHTAGLY